MGSSVGITVGVFIGSGVALGCVVGTTVGLATEIDVAVGSSTTAAGTTCTGEVQAELNRKRMRNPQKICFNVFLPIGFDVYGLQKLAI